MESRFQGVNGKSSSTGTTGQTTDDRGSDVTSSAGTTGQSLSSRSQGATGKSSSASTIKQWTADLRVRMESQVLLVPVDRQ